MKPIITFALLFSLTINAQSDKSFLNEKIGEYSSDKIDKLVDKEIISDFDAVILKAYTVKLSNVEEYTYSRLLDSLSSLKKGMKNDGIVKLNNHGKDSIFIRTPYNQKMFVGLGKMSLEKLVERESESLTNEYEGTLNEFISADIMVSAMNEMKLDSLTSMLFGNVILIKTENGEDMSSLKIGAVLEIANRIKNTDEFIPIKQILKL